MRKSGPPANQDPACGDYQSKGDAMETNDELNEIKRRRFKGLIVEYVGGRSGRDPETIEKTLLVDLEQFTASDIAAMLAEVETESLAPFGRADSGRQARFGKIKSALSSALGVRDSGAR